MPIDAAQSYDEQNVLAKILRGEIPSTAVYEDAYTLAIQDINPQAPYHVLLMPKGAYVSWDDFSANASDAEIAAFTRAAGTIARDAGLVETGYRLIANIGLDAHQEVPHLHLHIMAGRPLGPLLSR